MQVWDRAPGRVLWSVGMVFTIVLSIVQGIRPGPGHWIVPDTPYYILLLLSVAWRTATPPSMTKCGLARWQLRPHEYIEKAAAYTEERVLMEDVVRAGVGPTLDPPGPT